MIAYGASVAVPISLYCTLLDLPALDFEHRLLGKREMKRRKERAAQRDGDPDQG